MPTQTVPLSVLPGEPGLLTLARGAGVAFGTDGRFSAVLLSGICGTTQGKETACQWCECECVCGVWTVRACVYLSVFCVLPSTRLDHVQTYSDHGGLLSLMNVCFSCHYFCVCYSCVTHLGSLLGSSWSRVCTGAFFIG